MGVRLSRGKDGFVRVLSVTAAMDEISAITASAESSTIIRDGAIQSGDIVKEVAGIQLRKPITREEWGQVVQWIRSVPRPMKFMVVGINPTSETKSTRLFTSSDGRKKPGRPSGTERKIKKEMKLAPIEKMKTLSTDFINLSHRMKSMPKFSPEWTLSKIEMKFITEELEFLYAESMNKKGAVSAEPQVG
eukprot:CAMPEP_0181129510 /NCGR_PEP_ID=MMETSP1071-20121207/29358_1 /TAXON_ID=35127 /ORGANISM="Thalassiosira sp., Strain NH16" /LENGTH=189 /DNA_ID=CAMNT_0023215497 /DNA_START=364 /DNA_END=933 /DNA_ORIENTATION=+